MTPKIKTTHTRSCKGEEQYWCQEMRWVPGCRVEEAIRATQAEQKRKLAEMVRKMIGARPREIADAILAQEE